MALDNTKQDTSENEDTNFFTPLTDEQIENARKASAAASSTSPASPSSQVPRETAPAKTKPSELIMWIVGLPLLIGSIPYCIESGLYLLIPLLVISIIFDIFIIVMALKGPAQK